MAQLYCTDTSAIVKRLDKLHKQYNDLILTMQTFIRDNAMHPQEKDFYDRKLSEFDIRKSELEEKISKLETEIENNHTRREYLNSLISGLEQGGDMIAEFDEKLCRLMVEKITINADRSIIFTFWNGAAIKY